MRKIWPVLVAIAFLAASCGGGGNNNANKNAGNRHKQETVEFPFVELPPYIQDQGEAMRYIVRNFWKPYFRKLQKDTSLLCLDSAKFEEAFARYANTLIVMEEGRRGKSAQESDKRYSIISESQKGLFGKADSLYLSGHKRLLTSLIALSEKYFYDPNSPYLNEEVYIPALEAIVGLQGLDETHKLTYRWQLDLASLNRIGTRAENFEYVCKKGDSQKRGTLHKIDAAYLLLYFNNPDCNSCKGQTEILLSSPKIAQMIESGQMKVLSMYIDEDVELWSSHMADAPQSPNWIYARDPELILRNNELYGIRAIPSMYLLDTNKNVILKDAVAETVVEYFK